MPVVVSTVELGNFEVAEGESWAETDRGSLVVYDAKVNAIAQFSEYLLVSKTDELVNEDEEYKPNVNVDLSALVYPEWEKYCEKFKIFFDKFGDLAVR